MMTRKIPKMRSAIEIEASDPPALLVPADGITIAPLESLTLTFQVVVDAPLDVAITDITNTATLTTDQQGPLQASVTDTVVRPAVIVEPNNAGYAAAGPGVEDRYTPGSADGTGRTSDHRRREPIRGGEKHAGRSVGSEAGTARGS